jgi:hypothetical protein
MDTHEPVTHAAPGATSVERDPLRCPWCGRHFNDVDAPIGHFVPLNATDRAAAQWVHNACKQERRLPG